MNEPDTVIVPDGWTVLETITISKALNAEGDVALVHDATDGLNAWEAIGMLTWTLDTMRAAMQMPDEDDE